MSTEENDDFVMVGGASSSDEFDTKALNKEMENLDIAGRAIDVHQQDQLDPAQMQNNAGGFVWQVDDATRIRRFLILGTTGGTYYMTEPELTVENQADLITIIRKGKGALLLKEILAISKEGRAAKQNPTIFALALCARLELDDYKKKLREVGLNDENKKMFTYKMRLHNLAYRIMPEVCRIPTHLFMFVKYCEAISAATKGTEGETSTGWSRIHRRAIADWYLSCDPARLAMHVTKYKNREGWTHRDLLRLAHPKSDDGTKRKLANGDVFAYVVKGAEGLNNRKRKRDEDIRIQLSEEHKEPIEKVSRFLSAVDEMAASTEGHHAAALIEQHRLVREHVPTALLNDDQVWIALCKNMPTQAMIRNLGKMGSLGLLSEHTESQAKVLSTLGDVEQLHKAKIHPFNVLTAWKTYEQGHGFKGKLSWEPSAKVTKALEQAFYSSFANVPATKLNYCIALDVSGSMSQAIANSCVNCRDGAAAMSLLTLKLEPKCELVAFCSKLTELPVQKVCEGLKEMNAVTDKLSFGSTDCAQPMLWAKKMNKNFDVFVVYTDNETYFGKVHPAEALRQYRKAMKKPQAKLIVVGMSATKFTIADPNDKGMLDVTGFDASAPEVMRQFALGNI